MSAQRITLKQLEYLVNRLNTLKNTPITTVTKLGEGKGCKFNIGNYYISQAYGGNELVQVMNEGGGINVISFGGYVSKRELYHQLASMVRILENSHD